MSLKESFLNSFRFQAEAQGKTHALFLVADELGLFEAESDHYYASENTYGELSLTLAFWHSYAGTPAENMADMAKKLLPKLGELRKEFDETQNRIRLVAEYKGVKIILESDPPKTCTVEKVEEVVDVPEKVIPAHTEKKVRWVMKGDCDPLLTSESVSA